jgi:branched-chain amino acid aminotransferase
MINFNGTIVTQDTNILTQNRAYGDAVLKRLKLLMVKFFSGRLF